MATAREKYPTVITPPAIAVYPRLSEPDFHFKEDGEFHVVLRLSPEAAEGLIKSIDDQMEKSLETAKKENPKYKTQIKKADPPYCEETDEDGEPTGSILIKTRLKHIIRSKKLGKVWKRTIPHFDSIGNHIKVEVGGGSTIRLNLELCSWYLAASKSAGVRPEIKAVRVLELVEYGGGGSANSFGFEAEEEGGYVYEAPEKEEEPTEEDTSDEQTSEAGDASDELY